MDLYWPSLLCPSSSRIEIIDNAGKFQSPLNGFSRTVSRPGSKIRLTMNVQNLKDQKRAVMQAMVSGLRGSDRIYTHDHSYVQRGLFPSDELLVNNTFADGLTGWTSTSASAALSVSDRVVRSTALANLAGSTNLLQRSAGITVTQYAPLVVRVMLSGGNFASNIGLYLRENGTGTLQSGGINAAGTNRLVTLVHVPVVTSIGPTLNSSSASNLAGEYVDISYVSMARCPLVDNQSNYLVDPDNLTAASWANTNSTETANATTAPDGTATADSLVEDSTASAAHQIQQQPVTVSATINLDYAFSVAFKAGSRSWARVLIVTGGQSINTYINLTTGALGATSTGSNWSGLRRFVTNKGDGWWKLDMVARKTSADTTIAIQIRVATADATDTYTGNGTGNIYVWGATFAQSSVPVSLAHNGATANPTGTAQNLAGGINTKGWPVSTSDLLLPGDQIQIDDQLLIVTAPVNSDAAGKAFLQFAPSLRVAPADNAPVIITHPMGKFMLEPNESGWTNVPGIFSDSEITLVESA